MAIVNSTPLVGLGLPTTGDLTGTWGTEVNNTITSLIDSAISGTTTLSSDVDVTLTDTALVANQAREAILLWTASGTSTRYITAPARSKAYIVINATGSTQSIVVRGAGPTTGVTVVAAERCVVAWNGSDFVKVASSVADGVTSVAMTVPTGLSVSGSPITSSGTLAITTSLNGIVKGNGSGFTTATSGTDYAPATSGTSILYGNGSGGFSNVTLGSGLTFTTGTLNTVSSLTGITIDSPSYLTALGTYAGDDITSGINNVLIGTSAGTQLTTGSYNTALGTNALGTGSGHTYNVAIGSEAMYNTSGNVSRYTAIGYQAGRSPATGASEATYIGYQAGYRLAGGYNTGIGFQALYGAASSATGTYNVAIGYTAGQGISTGGSNTLIGYGAGSSITTGSSNTIIGRFSGNDGGNFNITTSSYYTVLSDGFGTWKAYWDPNDNFVTKLTSTAPTLNTNKTMTFELTSNTSLKISVRGTDGTTRSVSLTLT